MWERRIKLSSNFELVDCSSNKTREMGAPNQGLRSKSSRLFWLAVLCSALILTACGEAKNEHPVVDACRVISQTDAASAVGEAVKEGEHGLLEHEGDDGSAMISDCVYRAVAESSQKSVEVMIRHAAFDENTPESIAQVRQAVEGMGKAVKAVDGIGDSAFWDGETLHLFQGARYYLMVSVRGIEETTAFEQAKAMAQKTLRAL